MDRSSSRHAAIVATLLALGPLGPTGMGHADMRREDRARNIRVERQVWDEHDQRFRTVVSRSATWEWLDRLDAIAMRDARRSPEAPCPVACGRCPDQLLINVSYEVKGAPHHLGLRLREGLAFLRTSTSSAWSFADSIPAVLALLREALPRDAGIRDWTLPSAPVQPLDPDSAAYRADDVLVQGLPEALQKVPPRYPDRAREMGVTGEVHVKALVAADGSVARVQVQRSVRHLDAAALEAVRAWTFKPATCGGQPVAVWVMIPVRFSLR